VATEAESVPRPSSWPAPGRILASTPPTRTGSPRPGRGQAERALPGRRPWLLPGTGRRGSARSHFS